MDRHSSYAMETQRPLTAQLSSDSRRKAGYNNLYGCRFHWALTPTMTIDVHYLCESLLKKFASFV